MRTFQFGVKRLLDIIFSALLIVLLTVIPFLIVIPIVIKCTSPGGAIFKQERMGRNCKRFNIYKFRTMRNPPEGTYSVDGVLYKPDGTLLEPSSTRITKSGPSSGRPVSTS